MPPPLSSCSRCSWRRTGSGPLRRGFLGSRSSARRHGLAPRPAPPLARIVVGVGAAAAAVLAVGRVVDMGFDEVLRRPFDPVLDWPFVADAVEFLRTEVGGARAGGCRRVAVSPGRLVALTTLAALRLAAP